MTWPIVNVSGVNNYHFTGDVYLPVDPSTGVAVLYLRPSGGSAGAGIPAIEQGPAGVPADIDSTVTFTELAYDDATAAAFSWETITAPTSSTAGVYRLHASLHAGSPGAAGATVLNVSDFSSVVPGKEIVVDGAGTGFVLQTQKVGDSYKAASIANTASGNANSTLCAVSIPSQDFDWRPRVTGYTIITGTGTNVVVDLVARLNVETSGNVVAFCHGFTSTERLQLSPGPVAGSASTFDKVSAGSPANIYMRTEQHSGTDSYTTSGTTSWFSVEVQPIP